MKQMCLFVCYIFVYLVVCHSVVVEIARGGEPFAENAALMRLFSAVNSPEEETKDERKELKMARFSSLSKTLKMSF